MMPNHTKTVGRKMRKRLYQALTEDSKLIDRAHSASLEKTKKRFYADSIANDPNTNNTGTTEYIEPVTEIFALATRQFATLYSLPACYDKEFTKLPLAIYSNLNHSVLTSAKFFDWYMHAGKVAWKAGFAVIWNPFYWSR